MRVCEGEGVTLCPSRKGEAIRRKASLSCGSHRCDWPTAGLSPVHLSIHRRHVHGRLSVVLARLVLQDRAAAWSGPSAAFPSWPLFLAADHGHDIDIPHL